MNRPQRWEAPHHGHSHTSLRIGACRRRGSAALAQDDLRTAVVTYETRDLVNPASRQELLERLEEEIEAVCSTPGRRDVGAFRERRQCETEARARANLQLEARLAELGIDERSRMVAENLSPN